MTTAIFLGDGHRFKGFVISGHAGYGSVGSDIVCAAVSSAAFMSANALSLDDKNAKISICEGKVTVLIDNPNDFNQRILKALKFQLSDIMRQYPENLRLCTLTLTGGKNNV